MTTPATYGDVTREYRAARSGAGQIEGLYDLVWFRGSDAVTFLESLLSQDIVGLRPGEVRRSLLLGPKGKMTALLWVLRGEDQVGILTDAGGGEAVVDALSRYRIRVDVDIERDERPLLTVVGPGSPMVDGWSDVEGNLTAGVPLAGNVRSVTTADSGLTPVGATAWTAVRVEAGEPVMGVDVDEGTIPQESGLVPETVDFDKGCFLGQELVARINTRGRVNRRLMGVVVGESVIPPTGSHLVRDDKPVGELTSPSESLTLRAPVGLSLVRHEVDSGSSLTLRWEGGEAAATVVDLPLVG